MLFLYNLLFPVVFIFYLPFYLIHVFHRGGVTSEFWQRFGLFSYQCKKRLYALKDPVWVHAVSVGETIAAVSFVKTWLKRDPEQSIVFSCGTTTGFATAKKKMPSGVEIIYCPIDFIPSVCNVLRFIRPKMLVIFEVEIWPNLIMMMKKCGRKIVLVNGRMSDKSSRGYARFRWFFRPIFNAFSAICVQTEKDAERVRNVIGASDTIHVCNTMKFDQIPDSDSEDKNALLDHCFGRGGRIVFTVGSTHTGEEDLICGAFSRLHKEHPQLKMILVPRHQERTSEVEDVLRKHELTWVRLDPQSAKGSNVDVLLVNTTGELMNFYACADITYVGKSLAGQTGGHNIIEPAIFGKAILYGHHMENFKAVAALFEENNAAVKVDSDQELCPLLRRLLENPQEREMLGKRARQVVEKYRGAIDHTLAIITRV